MLVNFDKAKVMILKSKKITDPNFVYGNNNFKEVNSYKYLGVDVHNKIHWNYNVEKMINGEWQNLFYS